MNGRIDRSTKGNGLENNEKDRLHIRRRIVSLALAMVMVFSAVFIVMSVSDSSEAAPVDEYTCSTLDELKDAVTAANSDNDLDMIKIAADIIGIPTREGHQFTGWYPTTGTIGPESARSVTAQWAPNDDHIESGYVMEIAAACALEEDREIIVNFCNVIDTVF